MKKVSLNRKLEIVSGRHGKALIPSSKTVERKSAFAEIAIPYISKRTTEVNGCTFSAKKLYSHSKHFMYVLIKISGNFGSLVSSCHCFSNRWYCHRRPRFPRFPAGKVTVNIKSTVKSAFWKLKVSFYRRTFWALVKTAIWKINLRH